MKSRTGKAIAAIGASSAIVGFIGLPEAAAGSTACVANGGYTAGGGFCTTVAGLGRKVGSVDFTRFTGASICNYAGGSEGALFGGGKWDVWEPVNQLCTGLGQFSVGDTQTVNKNFVNKTWFKGKWKEGGELRDSRTNHCIQLNTWDRC
jgi:hypothetical protein